MSRKQKIFLLIFTFLLAFSQIITSHFAGAQGSGELDLKAVNNYFKKQVKSNRIPGMAVAIVQDDRVVFLKGYGEATLGQPVTPQTQFYIGSVTKSFTALAALQLVENGKLELDAPVQKYLPWFKVADPQVSEKITVRNLLNHTSGLSYRGDPNPELLTSSLEDEARLLANVQPNAPVASKYQYYNQNYRLLGFLIEQVSGQTYGDYLAEHIFSPLGMYHSVTNPADAPELAQGYSRVFGFPLPQSQKFYPGGLPSGYLITSAKDMAQYMIAQLNNETPDGSQLLDPALLEEMRTPPKGIGSDYGMGWMVTKNSDILMHGGAVSNFQSFVALDIKDKIGIAILYNQNSMENMLFENDDLRGDMLDILNEKIPSQTTYGWIGWLLLALAVTDLLNHIRLFLMLPDWKQKTANQPRIWLWIKVWVGILFPLAVIIGFPRLAKYLMGGSANWGESFGLMPDLTVWLLVGMGLNLIRSLLHDRALMRHTK